MTPDTWKKRLMTIEKTLYNTERSDSTGGLQVEARGAWIGPRQGSIGSSAPGRQGRQSPGPVRATSRWFRGEAEEGRYQQQQGARGSQESEGGGGCRGGGGVRMVGDVDGYAGDVAPLCRRGSPRPLDVDPAEKVVGARSHGRCEGGVQVHGGSGGEQLLGVADLILYHLVVVVVVIGLVVVVVVHLWRLRLS